MKMIIINGRFLLHRITGVERYAHELIAELDKIIQPHEIELAIPPETKRIPQYKNIQVVKVGRLHNHLWEHISFPTYVRKRKAISLNLCNVAPLLSPGIVCIHDVKIKVRPSDFSNKFLFWYNLLFFNACKRAKKIITVSEFSKKEICKYYKVNPSQVVVVPNAWQHYQQIQFDDKALEKFGLLKGRYYFSISSMEPNKNFGWIAETAKNNPRFIFAIAGNINCKVFSDGLGFEVPKNMKLLGYVSDGEAKTLMRDCKAFLFPTFYEGFGIPPLEAISAGCKNVIVSDTEVMHEVFGHSVRYINPNNSNATLDYFSEEEDSRKIKDILQRYSWEKSAKLLFNALV